MENLELDYVDRYRYYDFKLHCGLSFGPHIDMLVAKMWIRLGFLYYNKASLSHNGKMSLVKLTILPIQDYGAILYRNASKTLLNKLDIVYYFSSRVITGSPFKAHHCIIYSMVNLTNFTSNTLAFISLENTPWQSPFVSSVSSHDHLNYPWPAFQ